MEDFSESEPWRTTCRLLPLDLHPLPPTPLPPPPACLHHLSLFCPSTWPRPHGIMRPAKPPGDPRGRGAVGLLALRGGWSLPRALGAAPSRAAAARKRGGALNPQVQALFFAAVVAPPCLLAPYPAATRLGPPCAGSSRRRFILPTSRPACGSGSVASGRVFFWWTAVSLGQTPQLAGLKRCVCVFRARGGRARARSLRRATSV